MQHPTNWQPANYDVIREEHWATIEQLLKIGEVAIAIAYFGYRVLYFGKDAHGNNDQAIQRPSKKPMRVNTHYTSSQSNFDKFILAERAAGHGMTWLLNSFHGDGEFVDGHEWQLIECVPYFRSEPLMNDNGDTNIDNVTTPGTVNLEHRFTMLLFMYHRLVTSKKVVNNFAPPPFIRCAKECADI